MPYRDRAEQNRFQAEWTRRRRQEWITANGPCAECGSWQALELDHIDPEQKVEHRVWSWSEARRVEELKKCQVLCESCHAKKTAYERPIRFDTTQVSPQVYLEWRRETLRRTELRSA